MRARCPAFSVVLADPPATCTVTTVTAPSLSASPQVTRTLCAARKTRAFGLSAYRHCTL